MANGILIYPRGERLAEKAFAAIRTGSKRRAICDNLYSIRGRPVINSIRSISLSRLSSRRSLASIFLVIPGMLRRNWAVSNCGSA